MCARIHTGFGERELSFSCSPPEGASVCQASSIKFTLCPARVVLCLAATNICRECLMYIPKTERLFALDTWPEPSVGACPAPRGSLTLKHQFTCPITTDWLLACCILSLFSPLHLLFYTFVHLTYSVSFSPPPPFLSLPLRGFTSTQHAQTVYLFMHKSMLTD